MPRYAALIYTAEQNEIDASPDEWAAIMAEYNAFGETAGAAGVPRQSRGMAGRNVSASASRCCRVPHRFRPRNG